jgi:hypothetical protein
MSLSKEKHLASWKHLKFSLEEQDIVFGIFPAKTNFQSGFPWPTPKRGFIF